ncbi:MAG TPA: ATP-binding protein [Chthoniobacterales bacterium]|jgi:PAS domain S-box-containing protein
MDYRPLFNHIDEGFCVLEMHRAPDGQPVDFRFVETNDRFENQTSLTGVTGRTIREVLPDIESDWIDIYGKVALTGEAARFEHQVAALRRWFECHAFRMDGQPTDRVAVIFRNVTERRRSEEALQLQQDLLEVTLQHLPTGVALIRGSDLRYMTVNPAYEALAPGRAMLGRTINQVWPEVESELAGRCERVLDTGLPYAGVDEAFPIVNSEGKVEERFFSWNLTRIALPGEGGWGILTSVDETTSRKRTEEALQASNERFQAAVGAVSSLIWTNNAAGEMVGPQPGWSAFTGQTEEEYAGYGWTTVVHPEDAAGTVRAWQEAVAEKRTFIFQHRLRRRDGEWRSFSIRAVPILRPDGEIREWVGVHTDVTGQIQDMRRMQQVQTELRAALQETENARAAAERAREAKDNFLAVLSHELRTPLTPALMALETFHLEGPMTPEMVEVVDMIRRNLEIEVRLIDDLLDVTRIESGKLELQLDDCDFHKTVIEVVEMVRPDFDTKAQVLELDIEMFATPLHADCQRLKQVFWNLLKNASKFTPQGGTIFLRLVREGDRVEVSIADTGIGFDPSRVEALFNPFNQAHGITKRYGGLGLGLAIAKAVVTAHKGELRAASEGPGRGATFTISLPLTGRGKAAEIE